MCVIMCECVRVHGYVSASEGVVLVYGGLCGCMGM